MVRIANMIIPGYISYIVGDENADIELIIPDSVGLSQEQMQSVMTADTLEDIAENNGEAGDVIGVYHLLIWRSVTRIMGGYRFRWQTYRSTDISQIKADNEDLTQALLELAEIVGGNANG